MTIIVSILKSVFVNGLLGGAFFVRYASSESEIYFPSGEQLSILEAALQVGAALTAGQAAEGWGVKMLW